MSAPYTHAQNGTAEQSGGVIVAKAIALRIDACLPENIWPEAVQAAGYLANRSPTKSLDRVTPFETLYTALS